MAFEQRPINADLPPARTDDEPPAAASEVPKSTPPKRRQRKPVPGALKAIAGLFLLAVVFIVAAIVGGGGGNGDDGGAATPAPVVRAPDAPSSPGQTPDELGYPAFATANTTRVGGADPAANAAGVALAVFPSTTPEQRPAAVALVDRDDWQGAIAATVLMAAPLGAPALVSEAAGMPDPTAQALDALDPAGGKTTGGAQVFAIGEAAAPADMRVKRVGGKGPGAAAGIAALRDELLGGAPRHIVVAPAARPDLAMPAAAWAARSGDPVLFAGKNDLPAATAKALKRHPKAPVYVLGPSTAISSDVVRKIGEISGSVGRVSGEDAVSNAIAFARYADGSFGWDINDPGHGFVVAPADEPLAAAAAAPLSAAGTWGPLLLTDDAATLPPALRGYLLDVKPGYTSDPTRAFYNHVWVIGDQEAISVNEQAEIDELAALAEIGG